MFNSLRLKIARERRGLTKKTLAERTGITTRTLSTYENKGLLDAADSNLVIRIAEVLNYPIEFFYSDNPEQIVKEGVSFRAMTKLSASKRDAALSAGTLAVEFNQWLESRFNLRQHDILDCSNESFAEPESAAQMLREHWNLGELSISNMIHIMESKGVRVFSLTENCIEVDAFSFWLDEKPFIFLNTMKTPERSRFDAAHELGHLVLHKHASNNGRQAEEQADKFASAFLMPKGSILATVPSYPSLNQLLELKKHWKVSLAALIRRTFDLGLSSEWHYRQLNIELSSHYGRKSEPEGLKNRETSLIFQKIFSKIRASSTSRLEILNQLKLPRDELSSLTFNNPFFMLQSITSGKKHKENTFVNSPKAPQLKAVN
ncbi:XRE family transcriptional regulator [Shewanella gelidimarina]|uniref:helix-turn-helix domain-containing protein n=1 Tax=Shewanella gelidimarina TaxID=56813 RepID=UPI00200EAE3C|nr:XRE family transcriptional regulator [Shewanella gelidimarina]MCL1056801.1 XRE family transcriptional regulator [Shewanella gelidimarina]